MNESHLRVSGSVKQENPSNPEAFTAKTRCFGNGSDLSGHKSVVNQIMRSHFRRESVRKAREACFSSVSISAPKFHRQPKLRYSRDVTRLPLTHARAHVHYSPTRDDRSYSLP